MADGTGPAAGPGGPPPLWTAYARPMAAPRLRLLCLPHAGGGAAAYRGWVPALAHDGIEVWPVQLPGRENRFDEPQYEDLSALVAALATAFGPALRTAPYAVFGHSMGAAVALELAYEARRRGLPGPERLFLSGCRPPNRPDPESPRWNLPTPLFVERLRVYDEDSEMLRDPALREVFLPRLRADFALVERHRYRPEPPLACPLSVLGGLDDRAVPPSVFDGWASYTSAGAEIRLLGGPHFFLGPARDHVLRLIRDRLAGAGVP
ncbi:thioesterase II family protein [Actinomadura fibrosa]|uniref:Thioesterase II family protein n=1 Tax=Actinomadura fibrosa TaxID=111802 RepID=A0ABW2XKW3_9ACTN|nr:alpha/beta fold hydrolase [Actinomadura fibrosa]